MTRAAPLRTLRLVAAASLISLAVVALSRSCAGQTSAAPARRTLSVPMPDGTLLATDVYLPTGSGPFPVILLRTPYDKNGGAGIGAEGTRRGYAIVVQDTRGRFASGGENLPFEGDGWWEGRQDGYDTVQWISKQPWCSGKIGSMGGSAVGITQIGLAGTGSPHLTAQHIVVAPPDLYHYTIFPGGVFKKALVEDWLRGTRHSPDSLAFWTRHTRYDAFWRERDLATRWSKVNAPAVHLGGWYDIFGQGTIDAFQGFQTRGGAGARGRQKLVMGPWTHGVLQEKAGQLTFRNSSRPPGNVHDSWRWFDHHLKGERNGMDALPAVTYYTMGDSTDPSAPGNVWRTASRWPPAATETTSYYLHADRTLATDRPAAGTPITYSYDPRDPAPTVGGPQLTLPAGPMDQRELERRADVLVFTSEPLVTPLEVTGRVRVRLYALSDAPDTDFMAKLCDVYPDGRSVNICEGQLRARFRAGFQRETLLRPGEVARFDIDLWSTSVIFNRGHRLRVQVTSSSAPGYDPNPNTGAAFRADATTRVARNTLYVDARRPSSIELPVADVRSD
jgi:predicted acyl esterase